MSDGSKIEWTQTTWNPLAGCSKVSAGCKNCYAIKDAHRLAGNPNESIREKYAGTTTPDGRNWTGKVNVAWDVLMQPRTWSKPRLVFVNSMSDLFHESVSFETIDRIFVEMVVPGRRHVFQVLTKRPERMREYMNTLHERGASGHGNAAILAIGGDNTWPPANVWLGVSVENQEAADERIPLLLDTPAAVRWLSVEPLLGPVDLSRWLWLDIAGGEGKLLKAPLDWVVVGGESGPGARPMDIRWALSLKEQCEAARVPFFCKQLGARPYQSPAHEGATGFCLELKDRKGGDMAEWPAPLRVRQFPRVTA